MNRRHIEIEDIGGRIEQIPRDIRQIIKPMVNREYLRLRQTSEQIIQYIVPKMFNIELLDLEKTIDKLMNILDSFVGLNFQEFISKFTDEEDLTINYDNIKDSFYDGGFFGEIRDLFYPGYDNHIISTFNFYYQNIFNRIINYIILLFIEAGFYGNNICEILKNYNQRLNSI